MREKVGELRANVRAQDLEFVKKEEDLKVSQQARETLTHEMAEIRVRMESAQMRIEKLQLQKDALERDLKVREAEIVALQLTNSSMVTAREYEIAEHKKQLKTVKQELEAEKRKISPLQEELQRKREELAEKSVEIRLLREGRDSANSQVKMQRELADMKSRELASAATSHAIHMTELQVCITCTPYDRRNCVIYIFLVCIMQMQLASLKEKKEHSDHVTQKLQKTVQERETEIRELSQKIAAKEEQMKKQTHTQDAAEKHCSILLLQLEDMKMKIIELEEGADIARTAVKLAQEEAGYYQKQAATLFTTSRSKVCTSLSYIYDVCTQFSS